MKDQNDQKGNMIMSYTQKQIYSTPVIEWIECEKQDVLTVSNIGDLPEIPWNNQ